MEREFWSHSNGFLPPWLGKNGECQNHLSVETPLDPLHLLMHTVQIPLPLWVQTAFPCGRTVTSLQPLQISSSTWSIETTIIEHSTTALESQNPWILNLLSDLKDSPTNHTFHYDVNWKLFLRKFGGFYLLFVDKKGKPPSHAQKLPLFRYD